MKNMYKPRGYRTTGLKVNNSTEGETIEQKVRRLLNNKESVQTDGAPLIYTERKDGVQPGFNIRTDRFEVALEATDKMTKSRMITREAKAEAEEAGKVIDINKGDTGKESGA